MMGTKSSPSRKPVPVVTVSPEAEGAKHEHYIAIWSKAVDTQMHFNEMQVKSRQLGLTFITATLGVAIVLLSKGDDFSFEIPIFHLIYKLHVSVVLVIGSWFALKAVKKLDLEVYHPMLRGAVSFGMDFEQNCLKEVFDLEKGMTQSISHFSRFEDAAVEKTANGKYLYSGTKKVTAQGKIGVFYKNTERFLIVSALLLLMFTNSSQIITTLTQIVSNPESSSDAVQQEFSPNPETNLEEPQAQ